MGPGDADGISFAKLFGLMRRQLRVLVWTATGIFVLGALLTMLMPRTYLGLAVVKLQGASAQVDKRVKDKQGPDLDDRIEGDSDVSTEIAVITSDKVARSVFEQEHLITEPAFNPQLKRLSGADLANAITAIKHLPPADALTLENDLIPLLLSRLDVSRINNSYTLAIQYRSGDPDLAARVANAFAHQYVQTQVIDRRQASAQAAVFLEGKVEELRKLASSDFAQVQNYRVQHGLLSTTGSTLTEQELSVYNQQAASARSDVEGANAALSTAKRQLAAGSHGDDVGEALSSGVIGGLRSQRAAAAAHVADLSATFGPRYPELIAAKQNLNAVDEQIQAEINRVVSNLEAKANVAQQRYVSLESSVSGTRATLAQNNQAMIALDALQRKADASQALYQDYVTRYRDVLAQTGIEQSNAAIITPATVPDYPQSPKVPLYLMLAAFVGVFAGATAAVARELQFTGLTTPADVERRVDLPFMGIVPDNRSIKGSARSAPETLANHPNSVMAEAVRGLLSATQMPIPDRGSVLAITSALPREGKSTLAAMMALTAARQGISVVVVDCDIMMRGLSRHYGMEEGIGLQQVIAGTAALDEAIHTTSSAEPAVLPITARADAGERLTQGGGIQRVVAQLKERYELILLDCPPLHAVAEAREVAALADGIILAARWRKTSSADVRTGARLLPARLVNYIGVVLTNVDPRKLRRFAPDVTTPYGEVYQDYVVRSAS